MPASAFKNQTRQSLPPNVSYKELGQVEPIIEVETNRNVMDNRMKSVNEILDVVIPSIQNIEHGLPVPLSKRLAMKQKMLEGFDGSKKDIYRP